MRGSNVHVFQIFYSDESRRALDPGFAPLDNMKNERPDWFEFWVIRNFLRSNRLDPDAWYGFLSPKFGEKTGFGSASVVGSLQSLGPEFEVALFSSALDQLACYQNPFEQGEFKHPGLIGASQGFFDMMGVAIDLKKMTNCLHNSVFSNYIVAKPRFWTRWLEIADAFFDFVENGGEDKTSAYTSLVRHTHGPLALKVFIQERFASLILAQGRYRTFVPVQTVDFAQFQNPARRFLATCDLLKEQYCVTGNAKYLEAFKQLRRDYMPDRKWVFG